MRKSCILLPEGGYCYGVEAHSRNPFVELHGGFASYDAAYKHACELRAEFGDYGQSYERKYAHARAMAAVLREAGVNAYGEGRLD